jgi:hypothetical protein
MFQVENNDKIEEQGMYVTGEKMDEIK